MEDMVHIAFILNDEELFIKFDIYTLFEFHIRLNIYAFVYPFITTYKTIVDMYTTHYLINRPNHLRNNIVGSFRTLAE